MQLPSVYLLGHDCKDVHAHRGRGWISCGLMSTWLQSSDRLCLNASHNSRASKSLMTPFLTPLPGYRASVCPTLPLLLPSALHGSPFSPLIGSSRRGLAPYTLHLGVRFVPNPEIQRKALILSCRWSQSYRRKSS